MDITDVVVDVRGDHNTTNQPACSRVEPSDKTPDLGRINSVDETSDVVHGVSCRSLLSAEVML